MVSSILEKIDSLPPLPQTVIEIEEFRKERNKDSDTLLDIIEKDALVVATLLKISNSAMFGFRSKVETPGRAINLLGVNFTISIIIGGTIQNLLVTELKPYGIDNEKFMKASNFASTLVNFWLSRLDPSLKEELLMPTLLQEVGKYVISDILIQDDKVEEFQSLLYGGMPIKEAEKKILDITTSEITAKIFEHWQLSEKVINIIKHVDDIENCEEEFKAKSQILNVVKTACEIRDPLSQDNIEKSIEKAKLYGLDTQSLQKAIKKLEDKILDGEI